MTIDGVSAQGATGQVDLTRIRQRMGAPTTLADMRQRLHRPDSQTTHSVGHQAKFAALKALEAETALQRNMQGFAASRIARGTDFETVVQALIEAGEIAPDDTPSDAEAVLENIRPAGDVLGEPVVVDHIPPADLVLLQEPVIETNSPLKEPVIETTGRLEQPVIETNSPLEIPIVETIGPFGIET